MRAPRAPFNYRQVNPLTKILFTERQGHYLAFIHAYSKIHRCPPAEADPRRYFQVSPPTVHRMVMKLEQLGLISRIPGQPRSIRLLLEPEQLPILR